MQPRKIADWADIAGGFVVVKQNSDEGAHISDADSSLDQFLSGLRAASESTRLRLLILLAKSELNVTEITQILEQSQPRVSRHLKLMHEAGLLERYREGSWVMFRLRPDGIAGGIAKELVQLIKNVVPVDDAVLSNDQRKLDAVHEAREQSAKRYFKENAANWETMRSLHVAEEEVDAAILEMAGDEEIDFLLDLGTGTGSILRLLSPIAKAGLGVDPLS